MNNSWAKGAGAAIMPVIDTLTLPLPVYGEETMAVVISAVAYRTIKRCKSKQMRHDPYHMQTNMFLID